MEALTTAYRMSPEMFSSELLHISKACHSGNTDLTYAEISALGKVAEMAGGIQ